MKEKYVYIIFIVLFVSSLFFPLIFIDIKGGAVSEKENRMLASRPSILYAFKHPRDFIKKFDNWFSDNVGFREYFFGIYRKIMRITENNVQYRDGQYIMLVGEKGHHYFAHTNGRMIKKFQGKPFVSDDELLGMANGLNKVKSYLDEKGIPLIVMFCVDKETIYPEFYPKSILKGTEPIPLDKISDYIKCNTNVDIFNIKESLLSAKEYYPVFDKVGDAVGILSHYNEIGAFFAYRELMKHINRYMPKIKAFTIDDINITYADKGNKGIYKNIPDVKLKKNLSYNRIDSSVFDSVTLDHLSEGMGFENIDQTLPTILIMRDSYTGSGNYISRYIPEHFSKTILIHWSNMKNIFEYVEYFKPDIVVFQSAERELAGFAKSVSSISNLE